MIKMLIVDDIQDNIDVLELLIEDYMEENDREDYELESCTQAKDALEKVKEDAYDIVFLDIMMPGMDGFDFLQLVRNNSDIHQPIIVMVTALGDDITKKKEQQYGANAFMVKPINSKLVAIMLKKYLEVLDAQSFEIEDEFDFDFDFDDDFEEATEEVSEDPLIINLTKIVNKQTSSESLSAQDFLSEYEWNSDVIEKQLEDLDYAIFRVFDSMDENIENVELDIESDFQNILEIFEEFSDFVSHFSQLQDIHYILSSLKSILQNVSPYDLNENTTKFFISLLKAIITDLIDFKDKVFVEQSIEDINYLNASLASSCLEIYTLASQTN